MVVELLSDLFIPSCCLVTLTDSLLDVAWYLHSSVFDSPSLFSDSQCLALLSGQLLDNSSLVYWTIYSFPALIRSSFWYRMSMSSQTSGSAESRHIFQPICRVFGRTFYKAVRKGLQSVSRHVGWLVVVYLTSSCYVDYYITEAYGQAESMRALSGRGLPSDYCCWKQARMMSSRVSVAVTCPCLPTM